MSNTETPLTVLLPTYNCANFLPAAIKSILMQSFINYEFLIIDDGSTDHTEEVVSGFSDYRIKYVKKTHSGLASSLNYGLKIAKYDWVARMDADDISDLERLEKQINNFSFRLNAISCSRCAYFDEKGIRFTVETPIDLITLKEKLLLHSYICHPSVIYNRKFILDKGGYDERLKVFEDYELWLRILNEIKFEVIPNHLIFMRYNQNSLSYQGIANEGNFVRLIQDKYYEIGNHIYGINKIVEYKLKGWREYFYGSTKKARKFWLSLPRIFFDFRIIVAFVFTFLPGNILSLLKRTQLRYKIIFFVSPNSLKLKKKFDHTLKVIEDYHR